MVEAVTNQRCLIIAPSWVGDMVMAQSLFQAIKQQQPSMIIDVLAPAWCAALTDFMPEVNQLIESPFEHKKLSLLKRWQLGKQLRNQYDVAYVLPNSFKSALVPFFAKIPKRIGFLGEQRRGLLNQYIKLDKQQFPLMVQRFLALSQLDETTPVEKSLMPRPKLTISTKDQTKVVNKLGVELGFDEKVLVLCPGAEFGQAKQWPSQHYAAVARFYIDQGWQVWLMGSAKDVSVCQSINSLSAKSCTVFAGTTSLAEAVILMSFANLVVSNDSGLMHVAAALHKPLVAVYGSTDPGFTPPLNDNVIMESIDLECSPCFKRECPLEHLNCLQQLLPSKVLASAQSLVNA